MKVLVVNAGSSSLKYQLIEMQDESVLCRGGIERIGLDGSFIKHVYGAGEHRIERPLADHTAAFRLLIECLTDAQIGVVANVDEIDAIGHRIVHSGESFDGSTYVTDEAMDKLRALVPLAPLHMPAHIACIESCRALLPTTPNVLVFDTAFHATMPRKASMYAIRYEDYEQYKIRRYGFHGTSHRFVSAQAIEYLTARNCTCGKIVTCHLGNGSSITAVKDGKCVDTSMGMTPLAGIPMGTRSGDVDAAVVEMLCQCKGMDVSQALTYLNKECGFKGIGGASDARDLCKAAREGSERAQLAIDMFAYGVRKYIGAYTAAIGGLDAIVFTGGIGENSHELRAAILDGFDFMGIEYDKAVNADAHGRFAVLSAPTSRVQLLIIPTNEELVIARDTQQIVRATA